MSATLVGLTLADGPALWAQLGFDVRDDTVWLGTVAVRLGAAGRGIVSWTLDGVASAEVDGLAGSVGGAAVPDGARHPNGAVGLDHVVVTTPDFERTSAALAQAGIALRRIRQVRDGGARQGFRRLGPAILELVEARDAPPGPARFWGLVVIVSDLDALAQQLGDRLGAVKSAVQPGRRIATLPRHAGLGAPLAFMDPEPGAPRWGVDEKT